LDRQALLILAQPNENAALFFEQVLGKDVRLDSNGDPTVFTLDLPAASRAEPFSRENGAREIEPLPLA